MPGGDLQSLDGVVPHRRRVIVEFDSLEAVKTFHFSDAYQAVAPIRQPPAMGSCASRPERNRSSAFSDGSVNLTGHDPPRYPCRLAFQSELGRAAGPAMMTPAPPRYARFRENPFDIRPTQANVSEARGPLV